MWLPTLLSDVSLQPELQNLSHQLNQQIQVYTKQGFQIKDISSGMAPGSGETRSPTNSKTCLAVYDVLQQAVLDNVLFYCLLVFALCKR